MVPVIQEIRQPLVHTGMMLLSQMPRLGVFCMMLAKIAATSAARCRAVPLGESGQRHAKDDQTNQE